MGVDFTATIDHKLTGDALATLPERLNAGWRLPRELAPWVGEHVRAGPTAWHWEEDRFPLPSATRRYALAGPHGFHGWVLGNAIAIIHLARWWSFLYEQQLRAGLRRACRHIAAAVEGQHILYLPDNLAPAAAARDLVLDGGSVEDALKWLDSNLGEPISLTAAPLQDPDGDDPYASIWFHDRVQASFAVIDHDPGFELRLRTPQDYSMNSAMEILEFLEAVVGARVENTGWKDGYGLPIGTAIEIRIEGVVAGLVSDGSEIVIRRASGRQDAFDELCVAIREHVTPMDPKDR